MLTITLAALLAVLGTGLVLAYVHKANTRAIEGMQAVNVIVAKTTIPSGTSAGAAMRDGMLTSQKLPASSVPDDAVHSITPDLDPLVTSASMQSGQLLLRPTLVRAAQTTGGVAIPPGMVAVTVQLCVQEAVAGYVHAGSNVAVFDTYPIKGGLQRTCDVSHQAPPHQYRRDTDRAGQGRGSIGGNRAAEHPEHNDITWYLSTVERHGSGHGTGDPGGEPG